MRSHERLLLLVLLLPLRLRRHGLVVQTLQDPEAGRRQPGHKVELQPHRRQVPLPDVGRPAQGVRQGRQGAVAVREGRRVHQGRHQHQGPHRRRHRRHVAPLQEGRVHHLQPRRERQGLEVVRQDPLRQARLRLRPARQEPARRPLRLHRGVVRQGRSVRGARHGGGKPRAARRARLREQAPGGRPRRARREGRVRGVLQRQRQGRHQGGGRDGEGLRRGQAQGGGGGGP
mmetsp:Transcript_25303/g.50478  ORF Transcript_25303/g.50478 Transcript_25303/m.50478 type:complete len:230 (+) Transcript_25303:255-944(+)